MNRSRLAVLLVFAGLSVSPAVAQPTAPIDSDAPLSGPSVKDRDVPGVDGAFGNSPEALRRRIADRIPPRVMRDAMGAIMADDAPEEIRATPEQRERFRAIQSEYEQSLRDYAAEHREDLLEIRDQIPGGGPAADLLRRLGIDDNQRPRGQNQRRQRAAQQQDGMDEDPMREGEAPEQRRERARRLGENAGPELREKLRALMEGMPPFEQTYTKLWEAMTPPQREAVDARLDVYRERIAQQREDAYVRQRVQRDNKSDQNKDEARQPPPPRRRAVDGARLGPDGAASPPPPPPRDAMRPAPASDRRERLMRLFERLSPEQQDQLLERLEQRMREGGLEAPSPRPRSNRPDRGRPTPPPMHDVNVPSPDSMDGEGR